MPLRLIQLRFPKEETSTFNKIIKDNSVVISQNTYNDISEVKLLLSAEVTENFLDEFNKAFEIDHRYSIIILNAEACIPIYEDKEPDKLFNVSGQNDIKNSKAIPVRISREELFLEVKNSVRISKIFIALTILSTIVAAIGLINSNISVIVGAMVIAPFLGPNIATSFALVTADLKLGKMALTANILSIIIAFVISLIIGYYFDPELSSELKKRSSFETSDLVLAILSGVAGTLAFDTRLSTALVGVMVAVALLPPLVSSGLLLGAGFTNEWNTAFLLLLINLISINLSSTVTFMMQHIKPRDKSRAKVARFVSLIAIAVWAILLTIVVGLAG